MCTGPTTVWKRARQAATHYLALPTVLVNTLLHIYVRYVHVTPVPERRGLTPPRVPASLSSPCASTLLVAPNPSTAPLRPPQVVSETLPALAALKAKGLVRHVGITGLPLEALKYVLDRAAPGGCMQQRSCCFGIGSFIRSFIRR